LPDPIENSGADETPTQRQAKNHFEDLPPEILMMIFSYLDAEKLTSTINRVSRRWRSTVGDQYIWQQCFTRDFPEVLARKEEAVSWRERYQNYYIVRWLARLLEVNENKVSLDSLEDINCKKELITKIFHAVRFVLNEREPDTLASKATEALISAAYYNITTLSTLLLTVNGVDVNASGSRGHTILSWAARGDKDFPIFGRRNKGLALLKILCARDDIDINKCCLPPALDYGRSLPVLSMGISLDAFKILLSAKRVDVCAPDGLGILPLDHITERKALEKQALLLEAYVERAISIPENPPGWPLCNSLTQETQKMRQFYNKIARNMPRAQILYNGEKTPAEAVIKLLKHFYKTRGAKVFTKFGIYRRGNLDEAGKVISQLEEIKHPLNEESLLAQLNNTSHTTPNNPYGGYQHVMTLAKFCLKKAIKENEQNVETTEMAYSTASTSSS